jgi:hypothetical protein
MNLHGVYNRNCFNDNPHRCSYLYLFAPLNYTLVLASMKGVDAKKQCASDAFFGLFFV